jgi:hypothetical protein
MAVFRIVVPYSLVEVYRCFSDAYCPHHQVDKHAGDTSETSVKFFKTTRHKNPEEGHLHTCLRENIKSHLILCRSFPSLSEECAIVSKTQVDLSAPGRTFHFSTMQDVSAF